MSNYVKKIHPPDISRIPYGDWLPCVRNHSGAVFFVTFPPHLRYISITNTFYFPTFALGPHERGRKKGFRATPFAPCIQARPADLMKMKNTVRQSIILGMVGTAVYFCVGCSAKQDTSKSTAPVEVFLNATAQQEPAASLAPGTKTIIGGDRLDKVFWSERDTISVYWRASGSADALNSGQRFHCYQYSPSVSTFTTQMDVMAPGSYDYYAAFPQPAAVSGTQVSYDLPAVQDGTYDMRSGQSYSAPYTGNLDYMLAEPLTGRPGLASDNAMTMNFIHQCHVMRIQVPTGRNRWGRPIRKLRVEFPSPVVGRMTMDLTAPTAAPSLSDGSNTVTAELRQSFDESAEDASDGKYVWLFLCPGTVNGTVRFTAYDANGYQTESLSLTISKTLEAGHITPVTLTILEELPVTWLDFSITGNNLGESPNFFTVTAPEGATFRNGKNTQTFTVNAENKYSLGFYNTVDDLSIGDMIRNTGITITYDSENARVFEVKKIDIKAETRNAVNLTVPYLFAENFDGVRAFNTNLDQGAGNPNAIWLDDYGLKNWSACRTGAEAGKSLKISVRHETAAQYPGRVDSPALSGIKEGKSVNISVTFKSGKTNEYVYCKMGTTTKTGATTGNNEPENGYKELSLDVINDLSYDNIPNTYTVQGESCVQNCTNTTRLSWNVVRTYNFSGNGWISRTWYIYLDDIKVSILP